jgi:hypothetical protein
MFPEVAIEQVHRQLLDVAYEPETSGKIVVSGQAMLKYIPLQQRQLLLFCGSIRFFRHLHNTTILGDGWARGTVRKAEQ